MSHSGSNATAAPFDLATVDRLLSTTRAVRNRLDLDRSVARDTILDCIRLSQQAPPARTARAGVGSSSPMPRNADASARSTRAVTLPSKSCAAAKATSRQDASTTARSRSQSGSDAYQST